MKLRLDAEHAAHHPFVIERRTQDVGDQLAHVANARFDDLRDDIVQRLGGFGQFVCHQLVNPGSALAADALKKHADEGAQPLLCVAAVPSSLSLLRGLPHDDHGLVDQLPVEALLVAKVVIHRRDVGVGRATNLANRDVPESLGGLKRTEVSAERNAAMGMQISKAAATYSDGADHSLKLEIADTGALKGLMGFAAAWGGVEEDKETDRGYEKTYKNNGQLVHEKWDKQSNSGEYAIVVADRFTVQVSGSAASIDDLKRAAASVDVSGLAALKGEGVQPN